MNYKLKVIIPCYNEQEVIETTNTTLLAILDRLVLSGRVTEDSGLVYVDDGSKDDTWNIICRLHEDDDRVEGVKLSANYGHQNALLAGMEACRDDADMMVTIDADLQDDPEAIVAMVNKYIDDDCDIVYGVRRKRQKDTWFKRTSAQLFYKAMNHLGVRTVYNHADFRLMSRRAVEMLLGYDERNIFLRGIVPLIGLRSDTVEYDRRERQAGETKYPLRKMVDFAADGITSFSVKPVRMVLGAGFIFVGVSLLILLYVICSFLFGSTSPGWASLLLSIWFVGGVILIALGVIGEYMAKVYLEVKHRPRYNVDFKLTS
ncbi:MAG: glycosyltransferase family 2 protein [Prevotella sp.]|jgi:glycosyltransferase involved in cell wall biosynthesis|nr:glycosyltransferase family 2 protein [Prevotella sp.]